MKNSAAILIFFTLTACVSAQNNSELYSKGMKYKSTYQYEDGLYIFQSLLKSDSSNTSYLVNASYFYSKAGFRQTGEDRKMKYYHTAAYLAEKALDADSNLAEAHYVYALALGRINEFAGSKQKIANARLIKSHADLAIKLNPRHAGAYHILGRWHRTVAGFNMMEKIAINSLFGGVPEGGSYDAAIEAFQNAIKSEPHYILHYYELALTYYERNKDLKDKAMAKAWLKKAMELPNLTPEDPDTKEKCARLLKNLE